eukprot:TRINITY_DN26087_c0_g2_i1.p1 TRINITY_DN26087_c0_g2~~TRINITY_DN26087_c0_g2_i1.p1  ORF type:complete len:105 (-),score=15.01 TRINITY_DN26087_c0_g2_i1:122-436(-)
MRFLNLDLKVPISLFSAISTFHSASKPKPLERGREGVPSTPHLQGCNWVLKGLFFSLVSGLCLIQAKPMDQGSTKLNWHKPTKSPYREDLQIVQDFPISVVAKI